MSRTSMHSTSDSESSLPVGTPEQGVPTFLVNTMRKPLLTVAAIALIIMGLHHPAQAQVQYLGKCEIPADAVDQSNLTDSLNGVPHNRLGSFGSAICYTGKGNRYIATADRGPADGAVSYFCRMFEFDFVVDPNAAPGSRLSWKLVSTTMLRNEQGTQLVGVSSAFTGADPDKNLRFDPEGLRLSATGDSVFISDEYGPSVCEFTLDGTRKRIFAIPEIFRIKHPASDAGIEAGQNIVGRTPNQGFEGLALTHDGKRLIALLQSALAQDGARRSRFVRALEIDIATGKTRQIIIPQERARRGFNELLAVGPDEYLAIERDGDEGNKAKHKKIVWISTRGCTDVSALDKLPQDALPPDVKPAQTRPFIDLLDPKFGLAGESFPAKVEGLTLGPDLPDGRKLLLISVDNDFRSEQPSTIWAFALDPESLKP
jgi:hypothetical protein